MNLKRFNLVGERRQIAEITPLRVLTSGYCVRIWRGQGQRYCL